MLVIKALMASAIAVSAFAQTKSATLTLRPGAEGKDAVIFSRNDQKDKNSGSHPRFFAMNWTWDADGLGSGTFRSLIEFDFKNLPAHAQVKSAKLFLYCDQTEQGQSSLTKSNASLLQRVKAAWAETTVTWNNQPAIDTAGQITLAQSTSSNQNYTVDVTAMVLNMIATPDKNHGFLLRTITEDYYNSMAFGSSDNSDSTKRPKLVIEYEYEEPVDGKVLVLQPGGLEGKDASVFSRNDQKDKNSGNNPRFLAMNWTWDNDGLGSGTFRSLIEFDFKALPAGAKVKSANLHLFCDASDGSTHGQSSLTKSNASLLQRVKAAWAESTVTWNNQPATDTAGQITLAQSVSATQNYTLDVTAMVKDMVANPDKNNGFLLRTITEAYYNSMTFGSSDNADSAKRPKLVIVYEDAPADGELLVIKPGAEGKDAAIFSRNDQKDKNAGNHPRFLAMNWTWDADGLGSGTYRSLIEFDLKALPAGAEVKSANLVLSCDTADRSTRGQSSLTKSNASLLQRVKAAWAESTVTWNNQPAIDTDGQITLARSTASNQNYTVDVTAMVKDMAANPGNNHGFMLRTITEAYYNSMTFASSDNADSTRHPKLEIRYKLNPTLVGEEGIRRANGISGVGIASGVLFLSRPSTGLVTDLQGKVVARFEKATTVSLNGLSTGAYVVRVGRASFKFVAP